MDITIPQIDDNSAILEIEACGICGTDCEQFNTGMNLPMPHIPGHEPIGIIAAIGDGLAKKWGVNIGDRVAVETLLSCHQCPTCLSGSYHLCKKRKVYSTLPLDYQHGLWGAYSNFMFLDGASIVHKMDKSIPAEIAVMFNPLGAGFRWAVEIPELKEGQNILIMGPGQRGLSAVIAAKAAGAAKIIVTGLKADEKKLELAKQYGATDTIIIEEENLKERIKEITGGIGAEVVLDVTPGAVAPVEDALSCVDIGGTIVLAGVKGYKNIPGFVSDKVVFKEISIRGAFGVTSSGYKSAISVIESGKVPLHLMHTHNFSISQAETAIKMLGREIPGEESIHSCLFPEK